MEALGGTAQRRVSAARGEQQLVDDTAWLGNERGNSRNAMERGEHELRGLT